MCTERIALPSGTGAWRVQLAWRACASVERRRIRARNERVVRLLTAAPLLHWRDPHRADRTGRGHLQGHEGGVSSLMFLPDFLIGSSPHGGRRRVELDL